jgi:soluble lytic murein transglycosylase-like protein
MFTRIPAILLLAPIAVSITVPVPLAAQSLASGASESVVKVDYEYCERQAREQTDGYWVYRYDQREAPPPRFYQPYGYPDFPRPRYSSPDYVSEASQRFGIPPSWIHAVIRRESRGDVGAVSSVGAMGLMQLMPATWASLRTRYRLGRDPFDPHDNIMAGTAYLRELYDRYGSPGFLIAYNAGPARYEDYVSNGQPLPRQTRDYVAAIEPVVRGWRR